MLIDIRGSNGSGKTTVVRELLRASETARPLFGVLGPRWPEAYRLTFPRTATPTFVIGPYNLTTGGCDRIRSIDRIAALIEKYAVQGHVVFEGVIVASSYGAIGGLLERHAPNATVIFLDTLVDTCVERVTARRHERGDTRPFNPENLIQKHATIERIKQRITADGIVPTRIASSDDAPPLIVELLTKDQGGNP